MIPLVNTCSFLEWHQLVGKIDYIFWVVSSPSCWCFLFFRNFQIRHIMTFRTKKDPRRGNWHFLQNFKNTKFQTSDKTTYGGKANKKPNCILRGQISVRSQFFYKCWFYNFASFLNKSYFLDNCVQSFEVAFQIIDLYGSFCCRKINFFQWRSIPIVN